MKQIAKVIFAAIAVMSAIFTTQAQVNQFDFSFVVPEHETVKSRTLSGSAYLDYRIGQWKIDEVYMNNRAELAKVRQLMETVRNNPDATIHGITITGYASVDGDWQPNQALSQRRAMELKNYIVRTYGLSEGMFKVNSVGEDWEMLDSLVRMSSMPYRAEVLDVIRNVGVFQGRERALMQLAGGVPYKYMKQTMFPLLRRSAYRLDYTIRNYTVEESRSVIQTMPENLSLDEMYDLAAAYGSDTEAANRVFMTAAEVYHDSDVANINAAASALRRNDTASASLYLDRVQEKNDAYWNNVGALTSMKGQTSGGNATQYFSRANASASSTAALRTTTFTPASTSQSSYKTRTEKPTSEPYISNHAARGPRETRMRSQRRVRPLFAVKSNLLYDAATLVNVGIEIPFGNRVSLDGEYLFPWWLSNKKQRALQMSAGTAELRFWLGNRARKDKLAGWFIGPYGGGGLYDVEWGDGGHQGEFWHVGVGAGFAHQINRNGSLRMEYSLGIGYMQTDYRIYKPTFKEAENRWQLMKQGADNLGWFGPTRARVSLVWLIHSGKH